MSSRRLQLPPPGASDRVLGFRVSGFWDLGVWGSSGYLSFLLRSAVAGCLKGFIAVVKVFLGVALQLA